MGKVTLIGAGCGEMDLITLRGLTALKHCDALVYDDLIDEALLDAVPKTAKRIYMGKRSGKHSATQAEISQTLVDLAKEGHTVARLKGGDPFVFGRGGEEALALQAAGIPFEEIPGISSSIAIPAAAGIPVTHRGLSRSFHVVTGHCADGKLPEDLEHLAKLHGTLIFLMGLSHLEKITKGLMQYGKAETTPAAVLSGGNSLHPATVRGCLSDIAEKARDVQAPAVIVIGETAAMELVSPKPLQHISVGLTGTDSMTSKLKAKLHALGAKTYDMERSIVEPIDFTLSPYCDEKPHWLVFTSANGVRRFFAQCREEHLDFRKLSHCKFAVIGSSTGKMLSDHGFYPDLCPEVYTSADLAEALCKAVAPGEDVILLRADNGAKILNETLEQHGISVTDVPVYTLRADPKTTENAKAHLMDLDYLVFSSAGGIGLFVQEHGGIPNHAKCVCIGDVTARAMGSHPYLLAPEISADGILSAILKEEQA